MRWLRRLTWFVRDLFGRDRFERELGDELSTYVNMAAEEHERQGVSPAEARRRARLELGGGDHGREAVRDARYSTRFESVARDVRLGLRRMRRQPGFTAITVLTLAIGIGASAAMLSAVESVLLSPLPFRQSDELTRILIERRVGGRAEHVSVLPAWYHEIRERSTLVESITAQRFRNLILTGDGDAQRVVGIGVGTRWLDTLGVDPQLGRGFTADEHRIGDDSRVALLGHGIWQTRYGAHPDVVGRVIQLNGTPFTVIGVMPAQFNYPYSTDVWVPMTVTRELGVAGDLNVVARMRPGVTSAQFNEELATIAVEAARVAPVSAELGLIARPMSVEFQRDPNRSIAILTAGVGLVLLLACVNIATLLLARATTRGREMALRTALGAGRSRQVQQLLTESVLLALAGGALGVAAARFIVSRLEVLIPSRLGEVVETVALDGSVLAFSLALCVCCGLVFGLVPAIRLSGHSPVSVLRDGNRAGGSRGTRLLRGLVVAEVALTTVLLVAAGLLGRNVLGLLDHDIGYQTERLVRAAVTLPESDYGDPARRAAVVDHIVNLANNETSLGTAAITTLQPIPGTRTNVGTQASTPAIVAAGTEAPIVNLRLVTPGYFDTLQLPRLAGRDFEPADTESAEPVVIVSTSAARLLWPDLEALDQLARAGRGDGQPWRRVVGVVEDQSEPDPELSATVYVPYAQGAAAQSPGTWSTTSVTLLARLSDGGNVSGAIDAIRRAVREADPQVPVYDVTMMTEALGVPLADRRAGAVFVAAFAGFGLLLAGIGVYGTLAYSVSQRTTEFGVRLALGARPGGLVRRVLVEGAGLVVAGLVIGGAASVLATRLLSSVLTEVAPLDAPTWAIAAGVITVVGATACLLPAWRAVSIDPLRAMRAD